MRRCYEPCRVISDCRCTPRPHRPRRSKTYLASLDRPNEWILTSPQPPAECCCDKCRPCCDCQPISCDSVDELTMEVYDKTCCGCTQNICCRPQPCRSCDGQSENLFIKLILPGHEVVESESEPECLCVDEAPCAKVSNPWKTYFLLLFLIVALVLVYCMWQNMFWKKKKKKLCHLKCFQPFCSRIA